MREKGLYIIKIDSSRKMVVPFIIEEKLFNGKPILPIGAAAFQFIFVVLTILLPRSSKDVKLFP